MLLHEGDPSRCVVLLPGVRYFSQAPLLWFAREAALARGWSAVEVDERAPADASPFEWIRARAEEALAATDAERVVVIGKSLGSAAAPLVSGPAIWLTPLLSDPSIAAALSTVSSRTLLIGSPADPTWGEALPEAGLLEVLELPDLDHALQVSGDPIASLDVLRVVTERIGRFLGA